MKNKVTLLAVLLLIIGFTSCKNKSTTEKNNTVPSVSTRSEKNQTVANQKPEGITYSVSDVRVATSEIATYDIKDVLEVKIGKVVRFFPEELNNIKIAPCINNGLIDLIQECYDNHRPLILTPDAIWITICQGVSIHVNEHYDELKNVLFIEGKPNQLRVRNDSLEYGAKHWKDLIASFSQLTKQYTKQDYYSFFVSEFSTTTEIHKTAYEITLLESYKKGFEYVGDTGCGIPSIMLTGTKEDWQQILSKLSQLDKFGLAKWGESLKPVIQKFVEVFDGSVDKFFWQSIYKDASEYAAFYISGWIIKFFPYIKILDYETQKEYDAEHNGTRVDEVFKLNPYLEGSKHLLSTLSTDNFPTGLSQIEIQWNNYFVDETSIIEIYTGIMGIRQYDDKSLEPVIAWAACDEKAQQVENKFPYRERLENDKPTSYWSPHIPNELTDSAIYNHRKFASQHESLAYIQSIIQDSLANKEEFKNWNKCSVDFIILLNGEVENIKVNSIENKSAQTYIEQLIRNLPDKWLPALTYLPSALDMMDIEEDEMKLKIKVNSNIHLTLFENVQHIASTN